MWLKKDKYWKRNDGHVFVEVLGTIRLMLRKIKDLWPRTEGQGWNIPKFHEQLHVPDNILQNGSPAGTHSGPVEHNHIHFVKCLSKRIQKKKKTIDYQIASRTYENDIINNAAYSMNILIKDIEYRSYIKFIKWFFEDNQSK